MNGGPILFRVDGGSNIGMGHLTRSAGLAEACLRHDFDPVLLTRSAPDVDMRRIFPEGVDVQTLPGECSQAKDRKKTIEWTRDLGPEFLITDLCNTRFIPDPDGYRTYLLALKEVARNLVVIDDLHTFSFPADIVVNPNYGAEDRSYPTEDDIRYLTGTDYFVFRDSFVAQRPDSPPPVPDDVRNIVVTMGGSDHQDVTGTVCRAIERIDAAPDVEVITGVSSENLRDRLQEPSRSGWTFRSFVDDMAEVFSRADLAITAGGLTKYETAFLGVPSLVLSQVDHQHHIMQKFEKAGTCAYLGRAEAVTEDQLREELERFMYDSSRRAQMCKNGQALVDGNGRTRIIEAMKSLPA